MLETHQIKLFHMKRVLLISLRLLLLLLRGAVLAFALFGVLAIFYRFNFSSCSSEELLKMTWVLTTFFSGLVFGLNPYSVFDR